MLLKIMALSGDIGRHFYAVGEANAGNLAQSGVWLFGGSGIHPRANPSPLGAPTERRRLGLPYDLLSPHSDELIDRWQKLPFHFKT